MSLAHAILGILQIQPMTGYDLKTQCFDRSIAHFWPADQAQIYRTLDKMNEQGWVESQIEFQENHPNRKVYSITEGGRTEFRQWLTSFQALPVYREPFLIQLFFAKGITNAAILQLIEEQVQAHRERLRQYEQVSLPTLDKVRESRELSLERLTLELGLSYEKTSLEWLQLAAKTVRALPEA
ncbi:MAG: PadR family transcriptional regulator [Chloroflexota bacterium]